MNKTIISVCCALLLGLCSSGVVMAEDACANADLRAAAGPEGLLDRQALEQRIARLEAKDRKFRNKAQRRLDRRQGKKQQLMALKTALTRLSDRQLAAGCSEFLDEASMDARLEFIRKNMEPR